MGSGSRRARRSRCMCGNGSPGPCPRALACTVCALRRVPITTPNTAANRKQPGDRSGRMRADAAVVEEWPVWLEVNGEPAVTWMCTPDQLEELVVGWLHGEGYIASLDDLVQLRPCAPDLGFWADVKPERLAQVKGENRKRVLASGCGAVATVLGAAVLARTPIVGHGLLVTGRISAELAFKAARAGLAWVATPSVPSTLAVTIAERSGMVLVGRAVSGTPHVHKREA